MNIRTLRYYDQIGLVKPEYTDPDSGYRYYSTAQFEPLNTIRYLRELDVSLEEIQEFLHGRDIAAMQRMMQTQLDRVERRQRDLQLIRRKLQIRLNQLQAVRSGPRESVEIRHIGERRAFLLRYAARPDTDLEYPIRLLAKDVGTQGVFLGMIGLSIKEQKLAAGEFDHYDYIFLLQDLFQEDLQSEADSAKNTSYKDTPVFTFPESDYAVLQFRGTHTDAAAHYPTLTSHIKEKGYEISGNSLEITLVDYGLTSDPANFVTELQIPVRRR